MTLILADSCRLADDRFTYLISTFFIGALLAYASRNGIYFVIAARLSVAAVLVSNVNLEAHQQKIEALDAKTR